MKVEHIHSLERVAGSDACTYRLCAFVFLESASHEWQYPTIALIWFTSNLFLHKAHSWFHVTLVEVLQYQVLQDLALDLPERLPNLALLALLLTYLLHSRHVWLSSPPRTYQYMLSVVLESRGRIYLLPHSGFRAKTLVAILLRFGRRNFYDPAKELTLIHVVNSLFCIPRNLEFDVAKTPMEFYS